MAKIKFISNDVAHNVPSGTDLLQAYRINPAIPLQFGCTQGACGTCAIKIIEGAEQMTKLTKQEVQTLRCKGLGEGYRLACQCAINGDITIE